jgi:hypothetical protein
MGRSSEMGGAVMARGTGCSVKRTMVGPFVKISCLVTLRTDMYGAPGLRNPYAPLALTMETGQMCDLLVRCHYYWEVSR